MLRNNERRADDGFSLIELVVAVGIMMIMSAVGLVAYSGVHKNARQTAVEASASAVLVGALSYEADYDTHTTAEAARDEWMNTRGDDSISVEVEKLPGCLRVSAEHQKGETAVRQSGDRCDDAVVPPVEEDETGGSVPPVEDEETTPPVGGDASGLKCSANAALPNWDGSESPQYSHYAYLEIRVSGGFEPNTTVRAFNELDGSLIFEAQPAAGASFLIVDSEKMLDSPERDVFCDIRVEVHTVDRVVSGVSPAVSRDGIAGERKGNQEYVYLYRGFSLAGETITLN